MATPAKLDPITGPIPRDVFAQIVNAPHGEAKRMIRKYDPLFGVQDGEKVKWKVTVERQGADQGYAIIEASSKEEADDLADELQEHEIDWDYDSGDLEVISVEPYVERST